MLAKGLGSNSLFVITIDGTAGSGKTTLGNALAGLLDFRFVGSGLLYRAVTLAVIESGISPSDSSAIAASMEKLDLAVEFEKSTMKLRLSGVLLADTLQKEKINRHVATVAAHPVVRSKITAMVRSMADDHGCVVEGRDIGSVVFPNAPVKIYLDAQVDVRQTRRAAEGGLDYLACRDAQDRSRSIAPLVIPPDAVVIDSGLHDAENVLRLACEAIHRRQLSI